MLQRHAINKFLNALEGLKYGQFELHLPDGHCHQFEGSEPGAVGMMRIHDWRVIPAFAAKGDIGLAETYRDGWWESDDLTALLTLGVQNESAIGDYIYGSFFCQLASQIMYFFSRNTLKGSKRNIHAHYDLGNDFYGLWLDKTMTYSAALFDGEEALEHAQHRKYDRMIDRLGKTSGRLLEVGCGWGGFAERLLQRHDFELKGITISKAQHEYATRRLNGSAQIALEDYRDQQSRYDSIISIEMFEAVGEKFWPVYFQKMQALLEPKGKAVVQTITMGEPYFEQYRKGGDMIRSFIFPGGMLPSASRFTAEASKAGLRVADRFAFGQDYARTLKCWLENFEHKLPQIRGLGFDEPFIRLWRFYLAVCIAGFETGRTDVMQMELQHA